MEDEQPKGKTPQDDKRLREEAADDTSGDAPMDPQDESFIEKK